VGHDPGPDEIEAILRRCLSETIITYPNTQHNDDKTSAQILIRWSLQHGLIAIPKSIHEERIRENSEIFDFQLEAEDMELLDSLNENSRTVF